MPRSDAEEDANVERAIQRYVSQLQRQRQKAADHHADEEHLRQAMAASEAEPQRHANEALEHDAHLEGVMAQSLKEPTSSDSDDEWESQMGLDDEEDEEFERARRKSEEMATKAAAVADGSSGICRRPLHDPGHLAGTTQSQFEAQRQGQPGEKTSAEKTEEEIVMEYVKKQSLLEAHYQNEGKGRATATEDKDDAD